MFYLLCILFLFFIFIFLKFYQLKIFLFIIILVCAASDIGGFVFGKMIKGPKLTKISPNKTISGSIGSIILSGLVMLFLIYFLLKILIIHL